MTAPTQEAMKAAKEIANEYVMHDLVTELTELIDRETNLPALLEELKRFKALDACLPEGFAIGDDATATLAVELVYVKESHARLVEALNRMLVAFAGEEAEEFCMECGGRRDEEAPADCESCYVIQKSVEALAKAKEITK